MTLVDYLWVLRGNNQQALHDIAAKTVLVRVDGGSVTDSD